MFCHDMIAIPFSLIEKCTGISREWPQLLTSHTKHLPKPPDAFPVPISVALAQPFLEVAKCHLADVWTDRTGWTDFSKVVSQ